MIHIITIIKNGYKVNLEDLGLICTYFHIDSLSPDHQMESSEGVDGISNIDTSYAGRNIHTSFYVNADSYNDFANKRDAIYKLFRPKDTLTLIDNRQPHKQWLVQSQDVFTIDNSLSPQNDIFDLSFISKSPYAMGEKVTQQSNTRQFTIFNGGDVTIDPRVQPMIITFTGASSKLRIRNNTNGSTWQYKGSTELTDTIKIDMVYPYKNNNNIFGDTNYGVIELNEGSNQIELLGVSGAYSTTFEFAPLYI